MLTKQEFCGIIDGIEKKIEGYEAVNVAIKENGIRSDFFDALALMGSDTDTLLMLISKLMKCETDFLEWWCWDTEFGKKSCTVKIDDVPFVLSSSEKLYDFLVKRAEETAAL